MTRKKVTKDAPGGGDNEPNGGLLELEARRGLIKALATGPNAFEGLASDWDQVRRNQPSLLAQTLHAVCFELMTLSMRIEDEVPEIQAVQKGFAGLVSGLLFGDDLDDEWPTDAGFVDQFFAAARWQGAKIAAGAGVEPLRPAS